MFNYLLKHAIDNVWCNNEQDNQLIFSAHRVSIPNGVLNYINFMNRQIAMPNNGIRYHVYQIGQIHPKVLGLINRQPEWSVEQWFNFKDIINESKLFVDIYTTEGLELSRFKSHYMYTNEKNLILALEEKHDNVYLRLYSNAYYESIRADAVEDFLHCNGRRVVSNNDIATLQNEVAIYKAKPGYVYCYKNGYLINDISLSTVSIGDDVEYLYDSSIKRIVTFTINDLLTFNSGLDNKYKYLLHYDSALNSIIDYQDDIDIHVIAVDNNNRYKGHYYHRNAVDSHRMVTHRDYSIVVDYVIYVANALNLALFNNTADISTFKLEVKIRKSGYERPLIYDNNRIFELYKLDDTNIIQALMGINAVVPEWQASNLEKSAYTQIMRSEYLDINLDMIQKGYGYNSISKLVGDTPQKSSLISGLQTIQLPYNLQNNITAYEYDVDGNLLAYHYQANGYDYTTSNTNARLIEVISGQGTYQPDVRFGIDNIPLPSIDNYRVYMCYLVNGIPNEVWKDITGSELYNVINNTLVWNNLETDQYLMVRTDATFLAYDLDLELVNGVLFFTLAELEERFGGVQNYTLPVPLGDLDLFLNGKSLVEGIDYVIKFPQIFIISKKHLIEPIGTASQHAHIRFTGFCRHDLTTDLIEDRGFVQHGFLSNNNKHDIRDDKVLRIILNGCLKHRDDVMFSEQHDGISITNALNGQPYQIKDIVVPLKQLVNENTYSLRDKSIAIDEKISNYLTVKLPQPNRGPISAIPDLYPLYSPFIARIISNVISGIISHESLQVAITEMLVLDICKPYEYLLEVDPLNSQFDPIREYIIIHPLATNYVMSIPVYQYRFLHKVIEVYAKGLVDLSSFLTITASGV